MVSTKAKTSNVYKAKVRDSIAIRMPGLTSQSMQKNHKCNRPGCGQAFDRPYKLKVHIDAEHDGKTWGCRYEVEHGCKRRFKKPGDAERHAKSFHEKKRYPCPFKTTLGCDKLFWQKNEAKEHGEAAHEGKRRQCPHCKSSFEFKKHLKQHITQIHSGKTWNCQYCDKPLARQSVVNHEKLHTHLFICFRPHCNERFLTVDEAYQHSIDPEHKSKYQLWKCQVKHCKYAVKRTVMETQNFVKHFKQHVSRHDVSPDAEIVWTPAQVPNIEDSPLLATIFERQCKLIIKANTMEQNNQDKGGGRSESLDGGKDPNLDVDESNGDEDKGGDDNDSEDDSDGDESEDESDDDSDDNGDEDSDDGHDDDNDDDGNDHRLGSGKRNALSLASDEAIEFLTWGRSELYSERYCAYIMDINASWCGEFVPSPFLTRAKYQ